MDNTNIDNRDNSKNAIIQFYNSIVNYSVSSTVGTVLAIQCELHQCRPKT